MGRLPVTPDPPADRDPLATARRLKWQADLSCEVWLVGAALLVGAGVWVAALVGAGS